jgi:hypothetical protein
METPGSEDTWHYCSWPPPLPHFERVNISPWNDISIDQDEKITTPLELVDDMSTRDFRGKLENLTNIYDAGLLFLDYAKEQMRQKGVDFAMEIRGEKGKAEIFDYIMKLVNYPAPYFKRVVISTSNWDGIISVYTPGHKAVWMNLEDLKKKGLEEVWTTFIVETLASIRWSTGRYGENPALTAACKALNLDELFVAAGIILYILEQDALKGDAGAAMAYRNFMMLLKNPEYIIEDEFSRTRLLDAHLINKEGKIPASIRKALKDADQSPLFKEPA